MCVCIKCKDGHYSLTLALAYGISWSVLLANPVVLAALFRVSGKGGYEETNSERGNRKRKPEV